MKYFLFALVAVFLGCHTSLTSACNVDNMVYCVKSGVNCTQAQICHMSVRGCEGSEAMCYSNEAKCGHVLTILSSCGMQHMCTDIFPFKSAIEQKCNPGTDVEVSGVSIMSASTTMIGLLSYFVMK